MIQIGIKNKTDIAKRATVRAMGSQDTKSTSAAGKASDQINIDDRPSTLPRSNVAVLNSKPECARAMALSKTKDSQTVTQERS
jgi:hypothetical protein